MKLRTVVMTAAGFGIPLALLVLFLPITWGYGGYNFRGDRVSFVDPAGPAARAGLHQGDRITLLIGMENVEQFAGPAGTTIHFRVLLKSGERPVTITFEPFSGALGAQQRFNKILGALTALGAFIVAIIVLVRARTARVGERAAAVLVAAGLDALAVSGGLVSNSALLAAALYNVLPIFFTGASIWAALSLLSLYPPRLTRLRSFLGALGPWIFVAFALLAAARAAGIWSGQTGGFISLAPWMTILASIVVGAAIVDAIATAPAEFQTPTRWLGGCWLLALAFGTIGPVTALLGVYPILRSHYADVLSAAQVFFLAFGVGYPVLRHRLVDLNILVSRATAYGIVSIIIVSIFIVAEWAVSSIFEQSMGSVIGVGPQLATLAIALALGLSARSIHRFVEPRLTKVFFQKRLKGLAEIRRIAREADVSTDARAIMNLACTTVQRCLDPRGVAFYLRQGDEYALASFSGAAEPEADYQFNDAVPLRLRRWQEPFEIDDDTHSSHQMLVLPMMLRGELLGFLSCGPKPDHTPYLPDEIDALSLLAHQVGIASAWLERSLVAPPSLTVIAT